MFQLSTAILSYRSHPPLLCAPFWFSLLLPCVLFSFTVVFWVQGEGNTPPYAVSFSLLS